MIRNLKILTASVLALSALGAAHASIGQAAEFHCSAAPCTYKILPDGTGAATHHVIIIENSTLTEALSITCSSLEGSGTTASKTSTMISFTGVAYKECKINGSPGVGPHTKCSVTLDSSGKFVLSCTVEFTIEGAGCTLSIPAQHVSGTTYTTLGSTPNREITASLKGTATGVTASKACEALIKTGQELRATFTTGNVKITGETGGAMTDAWYL